MAGFLGGALPEIPEINGALADLHPRHRAGACVLVEFIETDPEFFLGEGLGLRLRDGLLQRCVERSRVVPLAACV